MVDVSKTVITSEADFLLSDNLLEKVATSQFCECIRLLFSERLKVNEKLLDWLQEPGVVQRKQSIFDGAVACLCLFVQQNYTGPPVSWDAVENLALVSLVKSINCYELDIDGEFCNRAVQFPGLLLVPYALLVENYNLFSEFKLLGWWALRTLRVYQNILSGRSPTLENLAYHLVSLYVDPESLGLEASHNASDIVETVFDSNSERVLNWKQDCFRKSEYLCCLYLLEISLFHCSYGRYSLAKNILSQSMGCIGFFPKSTGRLGRRMKYQERSLAQLWLSPDSCNSKENSTKEKVCHLDNTILVPPNIPLMDSDALGDTVFDSEDDKSFPLSDLEQVLLVANAYITMESRPKGDSLSDEIVLSTIQRLITDSSCTNSIIRSTILMIRNMMEEDKGRYQERVLKQWEAISELYSSTLPVASERLLYVYLLPFPPQVQLLKMFAMFLGKIGLVKNAMEIFEKLQRWEELIDCCCLIGHVSRAMSLIDERLALDLDSMSKARLYCILGDLTRDESQYQKAWDISNRKFARAMRSLGKLHVKNHQWELGFQSFLEALKINTLYPDIWFLLGFCAQNKGDLHSAANAFTRVVQQEPDNGEAWNNLAAVYVELKKNKEALFALSEAVKHKRESWKVWENLLIVSLSVEGEYGHTLNALEALVELKGRNGIYSEQLVTLVERIISEMARNKGNEALVRMCKRLLKLVGKITSMVSSDPNIWEASANLHHAAGCFEQEIADLQKQIRCLSGREWWNEDKLLNKMLTTSGRLNSLCIDVGDAASCYSSKLHTKKIIDKCKELNLEIETLHYLEQDLNALETKLDKLSN
ncbi:hypothetical protein GAYE_SCF59G6476 [Galdieria yellowstonensis]|uniref:Uncharacterized protein n=1 Tax=Galdieria yellowstonensis TaxID=3028027 RepID=A0AAV9IM40_9RHOD|nr:hypothetical protein GAYE_SCF59G6476 [Galdieria yellowstonensis]